MTDKTLITFCKYGSRTNMRFFVLPGSALPRLVFPGLVLGMTLMLTSCSQLQRYKPIPHKVFQYSYQEPTRSSSSANLAKQLTTGKEGSLVAIRLKDKSTTKARLGKSYFSASGYECRRYSLPTQNEYVSCLIDGQWLETNSIVYESTTQNP